MKKDVIYIDVEDDITSIIEKLKAAENGIVALVPPRRLGVLQSVVNLKLLKRAADEVDKKAVLITSDQSLINLTAGLGLPVARNLQSRPEVIPAAETEANETEVIEGKAMDGGDAAKSSEKEATTPSEPKAPKGNKPKKPFRPSGKKFKIPNFSRFRKRIIIGVLLAAAIIGFGVWAIFFAPKATVTIRATAEKVDTEFGVAINADAPETNPTEPTIKAALREETQNLNEPFQATGKKEVGEKATGRITIRNCDYSDGFTLRQGAQFVANGLTFVSTESVTVPKFSGSASSCSTSGSSAGKATVDVQASEIGDQYNLGKRGYNMPGVTGKVDAVGSNMSGGSKREITVVTQGDVDAARQKIEEKNSDDIKKDLAGQFNDDERAFEDTFAVSLGDTSVDPGVGAEASEATLTIPVTYSMLGAKNDDISAVLSKNLEKEIDDTSQQKVYDNGYEDLQLSITDKPSNKQVNATMKTTGYIGPNIDTDKLEGEIVGMQYGQIEALVKAVPGVEEVDVDFWPFWVTKAPEAEKTTVKLEVANEE